LIGVGLATAAIATALQSNEPVYRGRRLTEWVVQLWKPGEEGPNQAREALRHIGPKAVPVLIELLQDTRYDQKGGYAVRDAAAHALGEIGPDATQAIPGPTRLLEDPDLYTRREAAIALWRITHDTNRLARFMAEYAWSLSKSNPVHYGTAPTNQLRPEAPLPAPGKPYIFWNRREQGYRAMGLQDRGTTQNSSDLGQWQMRNAEGVGP
jgi:hypothetical protein